MRSKDIKKGQLYAFGRSAERSAWTKVLVINQERGRWLVVEPGRIETARYVQPEQICQPWPDE